MTWLQMAPKPKSPSQLVQGAFKLRMPEDLAADFHEWQQALIAAQRQQVRRDSSLHKGRHEGREGTGQSARSSNDKFCASW